MDLQAKLSGFYKTILREAESKNLNDFIDDCENIKLEIKKFFDELYRKDMEKINSEAIKLSNENNKIMSLKLFDARKKFLSERQNIKNCFFDELENKIRDFTKTSYYAEYMILGIKNFDKKKYKFDDFIFEFAYSDKDLLDDIKNSFVINYHYIFSNEDFIGGYRVYMNNKKIRVDKTLMKKLSDFKSEFNEFKLPNF